MSKSILPVVLCGGSGSRLWPLSREFYPKQLLSLKGSQSLLQETILRLNGIQETLPPLLICNETYRFQVLDQLKQLGLKDFSIILEPEGRNTAPAVAIAALHALKQYGDPLLLILPADHFMESTELFNQCVELGSQYAQDNYLVTLGIQPAGPETGYGYIERGKQLQQDNVYQINEFVEKPNQETAESYYHSGNYYWNAGIFLIKASVYLEELRKHQPCMTRICEESYQVLQKDQYFLRLNAPAFLTCPSNSIDYAIMEKTNRAVVIPFSGEWSDIGSWEALWKVTKQDENGNAKKGDVHFHQAKNCYIHAAHRMVVGLGINDQIIVETPDAILVADRSYSQEVKKIVSYLKQLQRPEIEQHRRVHRPWGYYEGIDQAEHYQVKRIQVNPGESLSLQLHHHRAEHWIVVKGTAKVTRGEEVFHLTENQSTYIPVGVKHRLENLGLIPLELIEVQSGSYLGEDDIVRFEDNYGRIN